MNDGLKICEKKRWIPNFDVISQQSSGETNETHEKSVRIGGLWAEILNCDLPNTK
jgi:hypothetical protein